MTPLVLISVLLAGPALLLALLRVNAMMVFLSLCLGVVLVQYVGPEAASTIGILASDGRTSQTAVALFLILTPAACTTVLMIRTVRGKFKLFMNFLIAIAVGVLVALLVEPLLAPEVQASIVTTPVWQYLQKLQTLVIALGAIFSLFFLWLQRPKGHGDDGGGKRHK